MTTSLALREKLRYRKFGAIVSAVTLVIFIALRFVNAPPAPAELKFVDANLLEPPSLFARGSRVRLRFTVEGREYCGVVDDYSFIQNSIDRAAVLNLSPKIPIRIGVKALTKCDANNLRVWQVEQGGITFLGLAETSSAAQKSAERPILLFLTFTLTLSALYFYAKKTLTTHNVSDAA